MVTDKLVALIAEIQAAPDRDGTITVRELAEAMGCSHHKARDTARLLVQAGKLKPERIPRETMWGYVQRIAGFRIVAD